MPNPGSLAVPNRCLGKLAPRRDYRTFQFSDYIARVRMPKPQKHVSWFGKVPAWGMMGNDRIGDCGLAGAGHLIQNWSAWTLPAPYVVPDDDIIKAYSDVSGYIPGNPATDSGVALLDALNYWRATGVGGHKIRGFCAIDPGNYDNVKNAIWFFGGIYIGVELPISVQNVDRWALSASSSLRGDNAPGSWGGHCVCVLSYDKTGLAFVSWGKIMTMSWDFWYQYVSESYAILSNDWLNVRAISPNGFNIAQLEADQLALSA